MDLTILQKQQKPNTLLILLNYKIFFLSLHYNKSSSYLFVSGVKNLSIKTADSEIKPYELCLSNISRDVTIDNMKKTGFYGYVYSFSVDYNYVNISHSHITSIHKYFMKKHSIV